MQTTFPSPSDQPPDAAPPRRLTRSRTQRMAAGVAGGLGEYFDVDPLVFRIAFVVLALVGGSGLALYLAAWLLVPEAGSRESLASAALHGHGTPRRTVLTIVLVGAGVVLLADTFRPWRSDGVIGPLVLIGLGAFALYSSNRPHPPPAQVAPPAGSGPGVDAPEFGGSGVDGTGVGTGVGAPIPPVPVPPRPASLTPFVLGAVAMAGGLAALIDLTGWTSVSVPGFLGLALVLTGAAIVAGAVRGRVGSLVVVAALLGVALVIALILPTSLEGGFGSQAWHPTSAGEVQRVYRLGAGDAVLDLRDVPMSGALFGVHVSLGAGRLQIIVPAGAGVRVHARTVVGETVVFGSRVDGVSMGLDRSTADTLTGGVDLSLDAKVGAGRLEVDRAA